MKLIRPILSAFGASILLCACAATPGSPISKSNGVLVNKAGMTLYTFDKDVAYSGKSACNGQCAVLWPALAAGDGATSAPYSVVMREDGVRQLAYKGKPLYLYSADTEAGERKGDNFKNIWHVVAD
jgi:predicted lipoprotein with Yx(FWY)xxD motif